MRLIIPIASCVLISACGVPTYIRPDIPTPSASASLEGSKAEILNASVRVLVRNGYQVTAVNSASGFIATAPQPMYVSPAQADCGRVKGLAASADPLRYPRPRTRVAYNIFAEDNHVEVRTKIDDRVDLGRGWTTLTCISRGVLEQEALNEIEATL